MSKQKTILVSGASAGFGEAMAKTFAGEGHRVIITGRREERLKALAATINKETSGEALILCFDIRSREACFDAIAQLPAGWQNIDILVNNAGGAVGRDPFDEALLEDWDYMLDTNVKGLLYLSKAVLPLLKKSDSPHIVNIGSIAGKEVYENGNLYCGAKFAVDAISKAMRIDLLKYGIKVTHIAPGAAETEFSLVRFKGDEAKAAAMYTGYTPLQAQDIANVVSYVVSLPPHVCINDLVITPTAQASSFYLRKQP